MLDVVVGDLFEFKVFGDVGWDKDVCKFVWGYEEFGDEVDVLVV